MKTPLRISAKTTAALLASLLILAGTEVFSAAKKDLSVSLKEQKVENLTSLGLVLAFHLNVANSSSAPFYLTSYSYRVMINQKEYLNLQMALDEPLLVAPRGETFVSLPVKITYSLLFEAIPGVEEKAACDLTGEMAFADSRRREEKIPFVASGSFPIFKDPEVELLPLKVRELTIGGTDLTFEVRFKNPNAFDLIVDKINYTLVFAGQSTAEGSFGGNKNIDAQSEKVFSLPLLLDFSELGKEVSDAFESQTVPCKFSGLIEVSTVWGKLRIPFDKSGGLAISRSA